MDMAGIQPSPAQAQNIREKTERYSGCFGPHRPGAGYAGQCAMTALPDHAASPLMTRLQDERARSLSALRPVNSLSVRWTGI